MTSTHLQQDSGCCWIRLPAPTLRHDFSHAPVVLPSTPAVLQMSPKSLTSSWMASSCARHSETPSSPAASPQRPPYSSSTPSSWLRRSCPTLRPSRTGKVLLVPLATANSTRQPHAHGILSQLSYQSANLCTRRTGVAAETGRRMLWGHGERVR